MFKSRRKSKENNMVKKTSLLIGFGNPYRQDDGVGLVVLEKIKQRQLANLQVINGGLGSLALIDFLLEKVAAQKVILLDAADAGKKPGSVFLAHVQQLAAWPRLSLHHLSLNFVLQLLSEKNLKNISFIGIQPQIVGFGVGLSDYLNKQLPQIEVKVVRLIESQI